MNTPKKCSPALRFVGFTNDWEQRKLGELGNFKNGMNFDKKQMGFGEPFVNLQDIFDKTEVNKSNLTLVNSTLKQQEEYNLLAGDILFVRSSVKIEGVGTTALIRENLPKTTYSGFIIRLRPYFLMNDDYKRIMFYTSIIRSQILANATSSANTNINQDSLKNIRISMPSLEEQTQIGNFFKQLDETIALHKRKLKKHQNLKKFYLEKMFPKENEQFPESRFPNFNDAWEQRKLGEIAQFSKGQGYSKSDISSSGYPIILYGSLYTDYKTVIDRTNTFVKDDINSIKSIGNEVIVPASGETPEDIARASAVLRKEIILGGDLNIIRPLLSKLEPVFLALSISYGTVKTELSKKAQGKSVVHIRNSDLQNIIINYPKLKEQTLIGNFFKQLDETIALHKRKIEKLEKIKQAYLEKMFI